MRLPGVPLAARQRVPPEEDTILALHPDPRPNALQHRYDGRNGGANFRSRQQNCIDLRGGRWQRDLDADLDVFVNGREARVFVFLLEDPTWSVSGSRTSWSGRRRAGWR